MSNSKNNQNKTTLDNKTTTLFKYDLPDNFEMVGDLAVDCEMMGLKVKRDRLCLVQIADENDNVVLVHFPTAEYEAKNLKKLLCDEARTKIFHFARADLIFLKHYLSIDLKPVFCTKIASRLTRTYTERHGLLDLVKEFLEVNLDKTQQTSNWGVENLSQKQINYAAQDVIYLHELRDILKELLVSSNRFELAKKCFDFLQTRIALDLEGFEHDDIFSHRLV